MFFERITVSFETIFAGDRVSENGGLQGKQGKGHISAKISKYPDGREIDRPVREGREIDNAVKSELSENNSDGKSENIYGENWLFGGSGIGVENKRNKESKNKKAGKFSGEIVRVFTVEVAIYQTP